MFVAVSLLVALGVESQILRITCPALAAARNTYCVTDVAAQYGCVIALRLVYHAV
jgi:hypothetical protein